MAAQDREQPLAQAARSTPPGRRPDGLGALERTVTAPRPKVRWTGLLLGFAVGVPLILQDPDRQFALVVLAVLVVVLGGVLALMLARRPGEDRCTLYAGGLTFREGSGPTVSAGWDQIQTVERGIALHGMNGDVTGRARGLTIGLATGTIQLSDRFPDSERLFTRIDQQFSERLVSRAVAGLPGGEHVSFASAREREQRKQGIASISAAGLRLQEDVFDWDEIRGVVVDGGQVRINTRHGRTITVPADGFPNLTVFVALVNQLATGNSRR